MNVVIHAKTVFTNLSPDGFHRWALHYYKCKQDFQSPDPFSPVPYFLLCRAMELEIKSRHLQRKTRSDVKKEYLHDMVKAYEELDQEQRILATEELDVLKAANEIYVGKGFEYFNPDYAFRGYRQFPSLKALDDVARKLISP